MSIVFFLEADVLPVSNSHLIPCFSIIGDNGFNLKALKSRPTKELIWSYYFYVEGEGNINSPEGEKMLKELAEKCSEIKVLGSFEREITL